MYLLITIILLPLLGAVITNIKSRHRNAYYVLTLTVAVIQLYAIIITPVNTHVEFTVLEFMCDKYSWIFAITINISWILSIIYTYSYNKYNFQHNAGKFFIYLHLTLTAVFANALAENLITLFIFYLLGILTTYPLLKLRNNEKSEKASRVYLFQTLIPPIVLVLPAIFITIDLLGTDSFSTSTTFGEIDLSPSIGFLLLSMFVIGFSQNSIFPFHTWLPSLHNTPAPVSALIHSVAAVKSASMAIIKVATYLFGLDYIHLLTGNLLTGGILIHLCGFTAIYTAYKAYKSTNLKERFSYSTVGQLMYILIGILMGTPLSMLGATLHILSHSIAKSGLFYAAGYFNSIHGTLDTSRIGSIAPNAKPLVVFIAICGLSITGFPFLAGYYSKDTMLLEEIHLGHYTSAIYLLAGSILNFFYILPIMKAGFRKRNKSANVQIPLSMKIVFIIIAAFIVSFSALVPFISTFLI